MTSLHDLNNAGGQRAFEVIPANTVVALQLRLRSGSAATDFLVRAQDGASSGLDCEFTVIDDGPYKGRKLWQRYTMCGDRPGHAEAGRISCNTLRAILESARGIRPDDTGEAAQEARRVKDWGAFDGVCFLARLGVRPPQNGFDAKNTVLEVITPDRPGWRQVAQIPVTTSAATGTAAPAAAIVRPEWAG
jgi:hypothetical protein